MDQERRDAMRDIVEVNRHIGRTDDQLRELVGSMLRPDDDEGRALLEELLGE